MPSIPNGMNQDDEEEIFPASVGLIARIAETSNALLNKIWLPIIPKHVISSRIETTLSPILIFVRSLGL
jgi:hypothetical protein